MKNVVPISKFNVVVVEDTNQPGKSYKTPAPLNLIAQFPSVLAHSQCNADTGIMLPSFNESFNKIHNPPTIEQASAIGNEENISEYNVSSSMSDMSSVCDVYAPSTSPISPVHPSSLMLSPN